MQLVFLRKPDASAEQSISGYRAIALMSGLVSDRADAEQHKRAEGQEPKEVLSVNSSMYCTVPHRYKTMWFGQSGRQDCLQRGQGGWIIAAMLWERNRGIKDVQHTVGGQLLDHEREEDGLATQ